MVPGRYFFVKPYARVTREQHRTKWLPQQYRLLHVLWTKILLACLNTTNNAWITPFGRSDRIFHERIELLHTILARSGPHDIRVWPDSLSVEEVAILRRALPAFPR